MRTDLSRLYMLDQDEVRLILQSASFKFERKAKRFLDPVEKRGMHLIPFFLDTVLKDSCSSEVREAFVRALVEAATTGPTVSEDLPYPPLRPGVDKLRTLTPRRTEIIA